MSLSKIRTKAEREVDQELDNDFPSFIQSSNGLWQVLDESGKTQALPPLNPPPHTNDLQNRINHVDLSLRKMDFGHMEYEVYGVPLVLFDKKQLVMICKHLMMQGGEVNCPMESNLLSNALTLLDNSEEVSGPALAQKLRQVINEYDDKEQMT